MVQVSSVAGFAKRCVAPGFAITVYDSLCAGSLDNLAEIASDIPFVEANIRDSRFAFEQHVHASLFRTKARSDEYPIRAVQKLLQIFGW